MTQFRAVALYMQYRKHRFGQEEPLGEWLDSLGTRQQFSRLWFKNPHFVHWQRQSRNMASGPYLVELSPKFSILRLILLVLKSNHVIHILPVGRDAQIKGYPKEIVSSPPLFILLHLLSWLGSPALFQSSFPIQKSATQTDTIIALSSILSLPRRLTELI